MNVRGNYNWYEKRKKSKFKELYTTICIKRTIMRIDIKENWIRGLNFLKTNIKVFDRVNKDMQNYFRCWFYS